MFAIWAAVTLIKRIVVLDDDLDPWDPLQVEWAMATRMKADRDLVVVPGARTDRSDPLEDGGVIGKLGIDATMRPGDRSDWTKAQPPELALRRARELLAASPLSQRSSDE
jgi:2,5-furandicarboxylate decarboxylase 1